MPHPTCQYCFQQSYHTELRYSGGAAGPYGCCEGTLCHLFILSLPNPFVGAPWRMTSLQLSPAAFGPCTSGRLCLYFHFLGLLFHCPYITMLLASSSVTELCFGLMVCSAFGKNVGFHSEAQLSRGYRSLEFSVTADRRELALDLLAYVECTTTL